MGDGAVEQLIQQAAAGDREAAGELARRYQGRVRAAIHRKLGPELRARADTDDLLQSTIMTALGDLSGFSFRGEQAFVGWLTSIAERQVLMKARHHRAAKRDFRKERRSEDVHRLPAGGTSPTRGVARGELTASIRAAIAGLPARERRVVELHSLQGLGFEEVARRLGLSGKSSAYRLFENALKQMGDILDTRD